MPRRSRQHLRRLRAVDASLDDDQGVSRSVLQVTGDADSEAAVGVPLPSRAVAASGSAHPAGAVARRFVSRVSRRHAGEFVLERRQLHRRSGEEDERPRTTTSCSRRSVYRTVAIRTVGIALGVTVIDLLLALPLALFISKVVRSRRFAYALLIMVTMPLWASYLVKGYAWRIMFDKGGVIDWVLSPFGVHGPGLGLTATVVALAYLWLPYMVLPVYAGPRATAVVAA